MKSWTRAESDNKIINSHSSIPNLHTNCVFRDKPKSELSCRRQVVHPRPQTPQGESVAKPETPLLIILSITCKSDMQEVHCNLFSPFFDKDSPWTEISQGGGYIVMPQCYIALTKRYVLNIFAWLCWAYNWYLCVSNKQSCFCLENILTNHLVYVSKWRFFLKHQFSLLHIASVYRNYATRMELQHYNRFDFTDETF